MGLLVNALPMPCRPRTRYRGSHDYSCCSSMHMHNAEHVVFDTSGYKRRRTSASLGSPTELLYDGVGRPFTGLDCAAHGGSTPMHRLTGEEQALRPGLPQFSPHRACIRRGRGVGALPSPYILSPVDFDAFNPPQLFSHAVHLAKLQNQGVRCLLVGEALASKRVGGAGAKSCGDAYTAADAKPNLLGEARLVATEHELAPPDAPVAVCPWCHLCMAVPISA
mmetsp:Transcript_20716/g.63421  ORF Transcript_20716/g.63421 Transcript_20716/m.63421 type:complete len:222 (-) Transcript_20716:250-915(-)